VSDRFAEASSHFVSTEVFFGVSVLLVLLWLPTLFLIPSVDTWQPVLNTVVSVLAFLLVALLQNSERRNDLATHRKLDAIAAGLADLMEARIKPRSGGVKTRVDDLRRSVGLEERVLAASEGVARPRLGCALADHFLLGLADRLQPLLVLSAARQVTALLGGAGGGRLFARRSAARRALRASLRRSASSPSIFFRLTRLATRTWDAHSGLRSSSRRPSGAIGASGYAPISPGTR
jgi:hypothetical protein